MKRKNVFILGVVFFLAIVPMSYAHEKRVVADRFQFVVGFVNEPAFSGQMNGVDLRVLIGEEPVLGLENTLQVTISRNDAEGALNIPIKSRYKEPGRYAGYFLPTKPGGYVFRIYGKINGITIDEKFQSGDKFHDVEDVNLLRFP